MEHFPDFGVGIDVVSLKRMERVLAKRGKRAYERLLTPRENSTLRQIADSETLIFAKIFAAKEAFFKASKKNWMGVDGFSKIEVKPLGNDQFEARWLVTEDQNPMSAKGCFFTAGDLAGAQVIRVSECAG